MIESIQSTASCSSKLLFGKHIVKAEGLDHPQLCRICLSSHRKRRTRHRPWSRASSLWPSERLCSGHLGKRWIASFCQAMEFSGVFPKRAASLGQLGASGTRARASGERIRFRTGRTPGEKVFIPNALPAWKKVLEEYNTCLHNTCAIQNSLCHPQYET